MAQLTELNFLEHFQRSNYDTINQTAGKKKSVFFMLSFWNNPSTNEEKAYLEVVDNKGKPLNADYRLYDGATFNLLRTLTNIKRDTDLKISWTADEQHIYLADYPYLLHEMMPCTNLVDENMSPITFSKETCRLRLELKPTAKERLSVDFKAVSDSGLHKGKMLTDVFYYADNTIFPIQSVGDNWQQLNFFKGSFPENWVDKFLSVFYSYIENTTLKYRDYQLTYSDEPLNTYPTLIFEKVDTDMALWLRVAQSIPGTDPNFLSQFNLLYMAKVEGNQQIVLKRINRQGDNVLTDSLVKRITKWAPNATQKKAVFSDRDMIIVPQETAGQFLIHELPELVRHYRIIGADKLKDYKVKAVKPKLNLSLGSGIDFLEGSASISVDDEEFSLKNFLLQYNQKKYIELANGDKAIIDESYMNRLNRLFKKTDKKGNVKVSFFDLPEVEELLGQRMEGEAFVRHRKVYEGFNHLAEQKLTLPKVKAKLRNYQKEGVKWMNYLYENNLGGCLADDMGLGKTLQTLTMLATIYPKEKTPSLIVMPRSLLFNWENEIKKFTPQLKYQIYYGQQRDLDDALKDTQLLLTTYALVRNDIKKFSKLKFHYVILDESQNIKNVSSQTTQAVDLLQAQHRLALSGTPIENNLTELYSLFRFLNPAMFGSYDDFNKEYTYPIQRDNDEDAMKLLRKKIYPFMLRRLKQDVLKELPERMEQTLYVEMSPDQKDFYESRRRYYYDLVRNTIHSKGIDKSQFVMFQALSELRRIASVPESLTDNQVASPKIDMLTDNVLDAVENGHKVVVFFNFIAGIELFGARLDDAGIDYTTMTGSTRDRQGVIERFQNDPMCKVLLMTLKTGGVGLNLTVADTVFIFEPWWNKAAENQAIDRLHRIGQKHKVNSYNMITRDTIEEKIELLQQKKADLVDGVISADTSFTKKLSEEDIQFILS